MKKKALKRTLTILLSFVMVCSIVPAIAFADSDSGQIHKWIYNDWNGENGDNGYINKNTDENVTILKGKLGELNNDNSHPGPYSKVENLDLSKGKMEREINVLIGPKSLNGGSFTVTASLDKPGNDDYLAEILADFRADNDSVVFSPSDEGEFYRIYEDAVYTVHWDYWRTTQGLNTNVYGQLYLKKDGVVIEETKTDPYRLEQFDTPEEAASVNSGYMWFSNISVDKGVRVFTDVPQEKPLQAPYKYMPGDWELSTYNDGVEKIRDDGTAYILKGGTSFTEAGYLGGPHSKKGLQKFENGPIVQELNILVDPAAEPSYVNNGVKFTLACALDDSDGKYTAETVYTAERTISAGKNIVKINGTNITIDKKDIYTFRIIDKRDIHGDIYRQLKVFQQGKLIGETVSTKIRDMYTSDPGDSVNNAAGHRYIWLSSINLVKGVTVYRDAPPYAATKVTLNRTSLSMGQWSASTVYATVAPVYATNKTVSWTSSNPKVAKVQNGKITALGAGRATITAKTINGLTAKTTVSVKAKKVYSTKAKSGKKKMTVYWKRDSSVSGYQVVYAQSKSFKKAKKTITIKSNKTTKKVISKLKAKRTYYVKVRSYKTIDGVKYYSDYGSVKKIKTKR